jgi:hypothetical protein
LITPCYPNATKEKNKPDLVRNNKQPAMTAEEIIDKNHGMKKPTPEEIKRARITALLLGAFLVAALLSFVYALVTQTKMETKVKELQLQIQQKDSLLLRSNQELKVCYDRAEKLLQKSISLQKSNKPTKSTRNAQKKNKPKKS